MLFDFSNTPFRMISADEWLRRIAADTAGRSTMRPSGAATSAARGTGPRCVRGSPTSPSQCRGEHAQVDGHVGVRVDVGDEPLHGRARELCRRQRGGPTCLAPAEGCAPVEGRKGVHTDFDGAGRRAVPSRVTTADGRFERT